MTTPIPKYRLFILENLGSLFAAGVLLFLDVVFDGTFMCSMIACPIWFLVSVIRSNIVGTEWRIALFRAAIPVLILGFALANTFIQSKIADVNGERIIKACESFNSDNGRYPKTLNELVPRYLPSIPCAKYCMDGDFYYHNSRDPGDSDGPAPILWWNQFMLQHHIYSFERKEWHTLD
jgi:hypothetical protein